MTVDRVSSYDAVERSIGSVGRRIHVECTSPRATLIITKTVPPDDMKGSGRPVTGINRTVMPTLTKTWKARSAATPVDAN